MINRWLWYFELNWSPRFDLDGLMQNLVNLETLGLQALGVK